MLKQRSVEQFMSSEPVGVILRVHATKPGDVPKRVQITDEVVQALSAVQIAGKPLVRRFDLMVWTDQRFQKLVGEGTSQAHLELEADCGETAPALRKQFKGNRQVAIHEIDRGDLFVDCLNDGLAEQVARGMQWSIILSAEARSYVTPPTLTGVVEVACQGARAVGVAIDELAPSIMKGRLANTFAMWHLRSLLGVGGFDHRAAKPVHVKDLYYLRSWNFKDDAEEFYSCEGVEEIFPLVALGRRFGPCLGPIYPVAPNGEYILPSADPALLERHRKKMESKERRQRAHAHEAGGDFDYLAGLVMPQFRQG